MSKNQNTNFEQIIKKISPILKRITYKLNGHFIIFNDEDLYQEALAYLWQDFNSGKLNDKTESYILQGCYFYLKNYIRKTKARVKIISIDDIMNEEQACLKNTLFLQDLKSARIIDDLHNKALVEAIRDNGLTDRQKHILFLVSEGLTTREIGARLGISHVMVIKLISRARDKCRKHIDRI